MDAFDETEFEKFKEEAREKWGKTEAYREYEEKTGAYPKQKSDELSGDMNCIMAEFAYLLKKDKAPDSDEAQELVKVLQGFITENYYSCTNEILRGLGQMYTLDERFRNNIDRHADGTAVFIRDAIEFCCRK